MAPSALPYGKLNMHLLSGDINVDSDTFKVAFTDDSYTPDQDADEFFSDVSGEITGTGYTAGGLTLANVAISYNATGHVTKLTADAIDIDPADFTARRAVVYVDKGTAATSPLVSCIDAGQDITATDGPFTFTPPAEGLATFAPAA